MLIGWSGNYTERARGERNEACSHSPEQGLDGNLSGLERQSIVPERSAGVELNRIRCDDGKID